LAKDKSG